MASGISGRNWLPEARALHEMFSYRAYLVAYPFLAVGVGFLYVLMLPGLPLGTLAPWVLQFLRPSQLSFSITMGLLLPLVALLNIFLWRHPSCCALPARAVSKGSLTSVLLGIVPNALCCSPIVPAFVAVFASGATLIAISGPIQYFFNTYAGLLYALATLGVWFSLRVASLRFGPSRAG